MSLTIETAANGFSLYNHDESVLEVFEDGQGEFGEHEAAVHLLYAIITNLGLRGSKHDAKRINIELENLREEE